MKKNNLLRKALVMVCMMALVACISVAATIAYFTDSESVTNTFTVGNVAITMDEKNTDGKDAAGVANANLVRDTANKYHLVPGVTYEKDPTIHVAENSEDCWLFVKVENGIADIETTDGAKTIAAQMTDNGWTAVQGATNIYAYKDIVGNGEGKLNKVVVFRTFTIDGVNTVNVEDGKTAPTGKYDIAQYANETVTVTAYAIQAAGFENSADAWTALKTQNGL